MKGIFILGVIVPILSMAQGHGDYLTGVHFCEGLNWQQVRDKAKSEHKYIFVDCFTTWCGFCKKMDKMIFSNDHIADKVNESFVSVRMQCDSSKSDGESVKSQYTQAHQFVSSFNIHVYPTYLFFSPNGELVHKGIGYQDSAEFIHLVEGAINPQKQYFTFVKNYKSGKTDYFVLPMIVENAANFEDTAMVSILEKDYIQNHVNRLPDAAMSNRDNLVLLLGYVGQLQSSDQSFKWILEHGHLADSVVGKRGFSAGLLSKVLYKEDVNPAIEIAKRSGSTPDWSEMMGKLKSKIGNPGAEIAIRKGKMEWYKLKQDWESYYAVVIEKVESGDYINKPENFGNRVTLNEYAYEIFEHSMDRSKLEKALSWMDVVVENITDSTDYASNMYDTKANLLYKLKRKTEAIALEARAVKVAPNNKDLQKVYQKMQIGDPTW